MVVWMDPQALPDPARADPDGLVAIGGRLTPELLVRTYRIGLFPWHSQPVPAWYSPDPRAIFDLDHFQEHRSVRQSVRHNGWSFRLDHDFAAVIHACAAPVPGRETTWITPDFIDAYLAMHRLGHAHSVEVYERDQLVGGLYGVAIGAFFGGESMFHRRADASKAALGHLIEALRRGGFQLLDAQAPTPHLSRLGAQCLPRAEYLRRLARAVASPARFPAG